MDEGLPEVLGRAAGKRPSVAALRYAAAGLAVLPCVPGAKRPLTPHGLRDASADPAVIGRWWDRWPGANVAVATGGAGVDVIDIDQRDAGSGFAAMARVDRAGLGEGWVARVATPSGGEHRYYPADPAQPQRSWALTSVHVDFRGTGGYILVPPSTIDGRGAYRLVETRSGGRPLDASAVRELLSPQRLIHQLASSGRRRDPDRLQHLVDWVAVRPEGTRNAGLYWAACRFAEAGADHAVAHQALGDAAATAGLGAVEIAATVRSAYRTAHPAMTHPRARIARRQEGLTR